MEKEEVKMLIEVCTTFEEANWILQQYGNCRETKEKVEFLKENFGVQIIDHPKNTPEEIAYKMMLTTIVNSKW